MPNIKEPMPPFEAKNNCPDCLYIELEAVPVAPKKRNLFGLVVQFLGLGLIKPTKTKQVDLYLTINFSEQWEQLPGGQIKFGLRAGELRLRLENAEIPYKSRSLNDPFELSLRKERQKQEGSKTQKVAEASWDGSKTGAKANFSTEQTEGSTDKFELVACQVETKGTPKEPAWFFRIETGEPVLRGSLIRTKLATIDVIDVEKPWRLEATFDISSRDVKITDGEGAWLKNLIPQKREFLDIALAKLLLKHKLKSPLSRVKLPYD